MKKMARLFILGLMVILLAAGESGAVITLAIDRDSVDFRVMENGQTLEVADQGVYHNEVTCTSTNNQTWYLKVGLVRPLTSGMNTIPIENLKWIVVDVINGRGIIYNSKNVANPFMNMKSLVYTSDPSDNTGAEVKIRFRYELTIPKNQQAGNYFGSVRWTMSELL